MQVIKARNVHAALPEAIYQIVNNGQVQDTRNGPALVMPQPVTTVYERPRERVVFWPERDANPFFHFYEGLWMLGGRDDVSSLTRFVKRMIEFSDDGVTFHGAYGRRWRHWFGLDQIKHLVMNLKARPRDRRHVLQIYDASNDLADQPNLKDVPCNLAVHFMVRMGALDMTVFNRSNDIIWGAYGANAVHFSMLHEFIATCTDLPMGQYWQVSDNFHAYMDTLKPLAGLADRAPQPPASITFNPYDHIKPYRMVNSSMDAWFTDLEMFLDNEQEAVGYRDVFFRRVALPIVHVHDLYKNKQYTEARRATDKIKADDWRLAIQEWLNRREARRESRKSTD
jgi:thymidylate synthase